LAPFESRVTEKGQITIPVEMRRKLGLKPRDRVCFELEGDSIRLRPAASRIADFAGIATPRNRPEDWRAVREEYERLVAADVLDEFQSGGA
jgi:AbrB family looped-hinge helix DNA binding protein